MTTYEIIQKLCEENHIAITALEKELEFGRGSIGKMKNGSTSAKRLQKIADYFHVSVDYLMNGEEQSDLSDKKYYINEETAEVADKIFHNKELRLLFDAAQDAQPEDLSTVHQMLLALKRKERGEDID